jgi:hypothetical protein
MKLSILIIFTLGFFLNVCYGTNYKEGDTLRVVSKSGLNLRDSPNLNSNKIFLIPFSEEVEVINTFEFELAKKDTIEGRIGNWIQIRVNNKLGFTFDGYLTKFNLSSLKSNKKCIDIWEFGLNEIGENCRIKYYSGYESESSYEIELVELKNGHQLKRDTYWEGGGSTELILNDVRLAEVIGLSILLSCYFELNSEKVINDYYKRGIFKFRKFHKVITKNDYEKIQDWYELYIKLRDDNKISIIFDYMY